jgi:hypothetical protein
MQNAQTWIATWQSLAPIVTGVAMLVLMKWMSRQWTARTIERTVRVTSRLRSDRRRF